MSAASHARRSADLHDVDSPLRRDDSREEQASLGQNGHVRPVRRVSRIVSADDRVRERHGRKPNHDAGVAGDGLEFRPGRRADASTLAETRRTVEAATPGRPNSEAAQPVRWRLADSCATGGQIPAILRGAFGVIHSPLQTVRPTTRSKANLPVIIGHQARRSSIRPFRKLVLALADEEHQVTIVAISHPRLGLAPSRLAEG